MYNDDFQISKDIVMIIYKCLLPNSKMCSRIADHVHITSHVDDGCFNKYEVQNLQAGAALPLGQAPKHYLWFH